MNFKILFRKSLAEENEFEIASKFFPTVQHRTEVKPGETVICRYSALPYYRELAQDLNNMGASLFNSYKAHRYVADINNWYWDLEKVTPTTWFSLEQFIQYAAEDRFILKGETNSKKGQWKTHMFAPDKKTATEIYYRLRDDSLVGHQNIVFRNFEDFVSYGKSVVGQPITKEFRVFVLDGEVMSAGFYWSIFPEVIEEHNPQLDNEAYKLIDRVINIVAPNIRFFVCDVAQKKDGTWRLIELNDGFMSGLSCVDPEELYSNMRKKLCDGGK